MVHMTTNHTTNHRPGSRAALAEWSARVDALIAAAVDSTATIPFVTFPRDASAGIVRHGR